MADKDKQVCTINVMFPVESDEQAIDYKKKITTLLSEIPDAQIRFGLMRIPTNDRLPQLHNA